MEDGVATVYPVEAPPVGSAEELLAGEVEPTILDLTVEPWREAFTPSRPVRELGSAHVAEQFRHPLSLSATYDVVAWFPESTGPTPLPVPSGGWLDPLPAG